MYVLKRWAENMDKINKKTFLSIIYIKNAYEIDP